MAGAIPLVRSTGMGPLPSLLEARAGERALTRILQTEGLPLALRDPVDVPVPVHAMMSLFDGGARLLGDRTLGLQVGRDMTHAGYGQWSGYAMIGADLKSAILRLNTTSWAHQIFAYSLTLTLEQGIWVWRASARDLRPDRMQHSDHLLLPMIDFCRDYLGATWVPSRVEVDYERDPDAHLLEQALNVPVRYSQPGVAVILDAEEIARGHPNPSVNALTVPTLREICADVVADGTPEPIRSIAGVVALRLLDGQTDIDGAAYLAGTGVQALQRMLRRQGYTYRDILANCRQKRAEALLCETNVPVSEIAIALGYEEHGNFTRAFSKWSGISPSEFRLRHATPKP